MTASEQKLQIFEKLIAINNNAILTQIHEFIRTLLDELKIIETKSDVFKDKLNTKKNSFDKWNEQFIDNQSLDKYIDEYGMTLREFRHNIYEAETGETYSLDEFRTKLKNW